MVRVTVIKIEGWCVRLHYVTIFPPLSDPDSQKNHEHVGLANVAV